MNEDSLFHAYRNTDTMKQDSKRDQLILGSDRCVVGECPTMIARYTGRTMCRFHEGKRRRGEK